MKLYLALGSNLGNREELLRRATALIGERIGRVMRVSAFHETPPAEMDSQLLFLNAALLVETNLDCAEVLRITQDIERELGRNRKSENGIHFDRTLDIDLLQAEGVCTNSPQLRLPHPEMAKRSFVMAPLAEIAPFESSAIEPKSSFLELYARLGNTLVIQAKTAREDDWKGVNRLLQQLSPNKELSWTDYQALTADSQSHLGLLYNLHDENGRFSPILCGMLTLCTTLSPTGRKAWVEDVVVDEAYRGRGWSHQLLSWAKGMGKTLGQQQLVLTSRPQRIAANRLYRKEGFEQRTTNVYRLPL